MFKFFTGNQGNPLKCPSLYSAEMSTFSPLKRSFYSAEMTTQSAEMSSTAIFMAFWIQSY